MNLGSIDEIIDFAIERERDASKLYIELSEMDDMALVKESLLRFAEEEKKHEKMLEKFKKDKTLISGYKLEKVADLKISDYMTDMKYTKGMKYDDLLYLAMKREEKAYKLYSNLRDNAPDDEHKAFFAVLANEEAKHKNYMESSYDDFLARQEGVKGF